MCIKDLCVHVCARERKKESECIRNTNHCRLVDNTNYLFTIHLQHCIYNTKRFPPQNVTSHFIGIVHLVVDNMLRIYL